jgi:hypothetical protein
VSFTVRHDYPLIPELILIVFSAREEDLKSLAIPDIPAVLCVVWELSVIFTQSGIIHRSEPLPEITAEPAAVFCPIEVNAPVFEIEAVNATAFAPEAVKIPLPEIAVESLPPFIPADDSEPLPDMAAVPE